jgi:hypothetical protein
MESFLGRVIQRRAVSGPAETKSKSDGVMRFGCLERQTTKVRESNCGSVDHSLEVMDFSTNNFQLFVVVSR